jgi:K+-sensing histidine kinase KdpD
MGLGLFLARAVIEGVGGTLQIDKGASGGTVVSVTLPTDVTTREPARTVRSSESIGPGVVSKPA